MANVQESEIKSYIGSDKYYEMDRYLPKNSSYGLIVSQTWSTFYGLKGAIHVELTIIISLKAYWL